MRVRGLSSLTLYLRFVRVALGGQTVPPARRYRPVMVQDAVLIGAAIVAVAAVAVAIAALVVARKTLAALRGPADPSRGALERRRSYGTMLRRYSELLGVEAVTGRITNTGESSTALRVRLETELHTLREPGAVELLDEVGYAREGLHVLEPRRRAAANGLVAMQLEWSIDRWIADPRSWLADCREQARLGRMADPGELAAAS
jgi:hypothetical protein